MPRRPIDEETYHCVKRMLKLGANNNEITKAAGVSAWTIHYIGASDSYKDYRAQTKRRSAEIMQKRKEKLEQQPAQPPRIEPTQPKTKDLRKIVLIHIDELCGEIEAYRSTSQLWTKEYRAATTAKIKLEEAQMWLESYI